MGEELAEAWEDVAMSMGLDRAPTALVKKLRFLFYSGVFYGLIAKGSVEQLKKEVMDVLEKH